MKTFSIGFGYNDYSKKAGVEQLTQQGKDLAYLDGPLHDDNSYDIKVIQHFATLNRKDMRDVILTGMGLMPVK